MREWLAETAHTRIHGTYRQPVGEGREKEKAFLGSLPPAHDTSLTIFRPVHNECQLSYNGNRYLVPHHVAGKKVMLKIKGKIIRIYHDQELPATCEEPEEKHTLAGDPAIYRTLMKDRLQANKKYGRQKGRATRGLTTGTLFPEVAIRSLAEYERLAGGASWSN